MTRAVIVLAMSLAAAGAQRLEVPLVRQQKNGCGAASVAMVARYWDPANAPEHADVYAALIDDEGQGTELARMKAYFEQVGFRAYTMRGAWADVEQQLGKGRPVIVALRSSSSKRLHFAVVTGVENGRVWLNDPTKRKPRGPVRAEFAREWAGAARWMLLAAPTAAK